MEKSVPFHMRLFNAAFRIPLLPFKTKQRIAYSFLPAEKAKELKQLEREMCGGFNQQFGTYEALMEFAPNFAKWQTEEVLAQVTGGKLVVSGAAMALMDYWAVKDIDLFFAKQIQSAQDLEDFCKVVYRLAFNFKEWGWIDENDKPVELSEEEKERQPEMLWAGMSHFMMEEFRREKHDVSGWMEILKPYFIKDRL